MQLERGFINKRSDILEFASSAKTCDADFRINEGAVKTGEFFWAEHTGKGTTMGRKKPICIKGS